VESYLPFLGIVLQWARSSKRFPDWAVALIVAAAAVGSAYLSGVDLTDVDSWGIRGILGYVLMTFGVTQATSFAANIAVAAGANPEHPAIPVTSSK